MMWHGTHSVPVSRRRVAPSAASFGVASHTAPPAVDYSRPIVADDMPLAVAAAAGRENSF